MINKINKKNLSLAIRYNLLTIFILFSLNSNLFAGGENIKNTSLDSIYFPETELDKDKSLAAQYKELGEDEFRFCFWNLKNYLIETRTFKVNKSDIEVINSAFGNSNKKNGKSKIYTIRKKKEGSIKSLLKTLTYINPSVLVVCEIGNEDDIMDLKDRLSKLGYDFPHVTFNNTKTSSRRLAIYSKYPFVEENNQSLVKYHIRNEAFFLRRGILDVSVKSSEDNVYRILGVHLKSKRPSGREDITSERMTEQESVILREYLDKIIDEKEEQNIILCGDFNSTKREAPYKIIKGRYKIDNKRNPKYMYHINLRDENNHKWTFYWDRDDSYSRIDFIYANKLGFDKVNSEKSYIHYDFNFYRSSDHRPLVICLKK